MGISEILKWLAERAVFDVVQVIALLVSGASTLIIAIIQNKKRKKENKKKNTAVYALSEAAKDSENAIKIYEEKVLLIDSYINALNSGEKQDPDFANYLLLLNNYQINTLFNEYKDAVYKVYQTLTHYLGDLSENSTVNLYVKELRKYFLDYDGLYMNARLAFENHCNTHTRIANANKAKNGTKIDEKEKEELSNAASIVRINFEPLKNRNDYIYKFCIKEILDNYSKKSDNENPNLTEKPVDYAEIKQKIDKLIEAEHDAGVFEYASENSISATNENDNNEQEIPEDMQNKVKNISVEIDSLKEELFRFVDECNENHMLDSLQLLSPKTKNEPDLSDACCEILKFFADYQAKIREKIYNILHVCEENGVKIEDKNFLKLSAAASYDNLSDLLEDFEKTGNLILLDNERSAPLDEETKQELLKKESDILTKYINYTLQFAISINDFLTSN